MQLRACLSAFLASALAAGAAPIPVKELEFLLRQGVSQDEIAREAAQRRLAAPLDETATAALVKSGASAALIARLKAPAMVLSPEESRSQLQKQIAQEALAKKAAAEEARAQAELAQRPRPLAPPSLPPPAAQRATGSSTTATRQMLEGKLVRLDGDTLKPWDTRELEKVRIFAFYYSAMWCGPCRKFTPELVAAYRTLKAKHPEFEVVFVSSDRDEFNMTEYMRSSKMPWPAVRFGAADDAIMKFAGSGIPWLVAVSDSGLALTKNGVDKKYLPPAEVLNGIEFLLGKVAAR